MIFTKRFFKEINTNQSQQKIDVRSYGKIENVGEIISQKEIG
jgi:hypothetical protein